jgi:hypothetical protein
MDNRRYKMRTARIVGALFIVATVSFVAADSLSGPVLNAPDLLTRLPSDRTLVTIGALLEWVNCAAILGIGVLLFPFLRQESESIALGYVGARIIESVLLALSAVVPLSLIALGQTYAQADAPDAASFQVYGVLALADRTLTHEVAMLALGIGSLLLGYLLFKSKRVPWWIAVLGMVGGALVLAGNLLALFGIDLVMLMSAPIAVQEMILAIWLIVKGLKPSASVSADV